MGHGGSIPKEFVRRWYNAVLMAESTDPENILLAYSGLASTASQHAAKKSQETHFNLGNSQQDLCFANLLRDHHLRQPFKN
jgi:hypothetical protein